MIISQIIDDIVYADYVVDLSGKRLWLAHSLKLNNKNRHFLRVTILWIMDDGIKRK